MQGLEKDRCEVKWFDLPLPVKVIRSIWIESIKSPGNGSSLLRKRRDE